MRFDIGKIIRIEPDWKVRRNTSYKDSYLFYIRIEPDWACGLREIQRENPDK